MYHLSSSHLYLAALFVVLFEIWLMYATYNVAVKKHRIPGIWLVNALFGGVGVFVILALSDELAYDSDIDTREEPDLLGTTIFLGNVTIAIILIIFIDFILALFPQF